MNILNEVYESLCRFLLKFIAEVDWKAFRWRKKSLLNFRHILESFKINIKKESFKKKLKRKVSSSKNFHEIFYSRTQLPTQNLVLILIAVGEIFSGHYKIYKFSFVTQTIIRG